MLNHLIASIFILFCFTTCPVIANNTATTIDSVYFFSYKNEGGIEKDSISTKERRKKKLVAAITAFPFPLGFVGAHRVMLGTKPWVPVIYVATLGGVFGLLPLIDFCVIVFSKDIEQYENNPNIFMWVK